MSKLQLHAITLENRIKLQLITILITPTLRGAMDKPAALYTGVPILLPVG